MSTYNIGFYEDLTKIIFQLSSNTQLISSSELSVKNLNFAARTSVLPSFLTRYLANSHIN